MMEIDFAEPVYAICTCCGERSTRLTRFVNRAGHMVAAYYLTFTEEHLPRGIYGLVGLGDWSDDERPAAAKRVAIAFTLVSGADGNRVAIIDAAASPWQGPTELGRPLSRAEAISHPLLKAVYALTDEMVTRDLPVMLYLGKGG